MAEPDEAHPEAVISPSTVPSTSEPKEYPPLTRTATALVAPAPAPAAPSNRGGSRCLKRLQVQGADVKALPKKDYPDVADPVAVEGPLGGVRYHYRGKREVHAVMDCSLAAALLRAGPILKRFGIEKVIHYSALRPGARVARSGRISGHASGKAIDLGEFLGKTHLKVEKDFGVVRRGAPPCPPPKTARELPLRQLVCALADANLFQVLLTPNYNADHRDHLHLEVTASTASTYLR